MSSSSQDLVDNNPKKNDSKNNAKKYLCLSDVDVAGKKVLCRMDFNVPMQGGEITDESRLRAAIPTLQYLLEKNAAIIIFSHLGRPTEGEITAQDSLQPVALALSKCIGHPVLFEPIWENANAAPGEIVLCENVRFNCGEKNNDADLAKRYAALCDVFVMDAFATAHRAQASTCGVIEFAPVACAGPLLDKELSTIENALHAPQSPCCAVVGGSKVSSKFKLLKNLIKRVDTLITGGGIVNTLLVAAGHEVGKSLFEEDQVDAAQELMREAAARNIEIPLPTDVVVAEAFAADAAHRICAVGEIKANEMILDLGPESAQRMADKVLNAGTIIWNGPVGVFEMPAFAEGTRCIADAIARSKGLSLAGGGDTLAAISQFGIAEDIDILSTGGGAFLECLQGDTLPAVAALQQRA